MKKLSKFLVTVIFCLGVAFTAVTPAFAAVANVKGVKASVTGTSVTLSWNKVSGATGYNVQQYKNGEWKKISNTTKTKLTVKKLKTGVKYNFRIRAYKNNGKKVQYGKFTKVSAKPVCIAPKEVKAVSASATSVKLSWTKLSSATGYLIQKYTENGWVKAASTKSTSVTITGLKTNEEVKLRVRGYTTVNGKNVYGYAKSVVAKPTLPAPTGVKATASSSTTATVSWNAVSGAVGYAVQRYDAQNKKWVGAGSTSKTSLTVKNLIPTTNNKLRVLAYVNGSNGNSYGLASSAVSVKPTINKATDLSFNEYATDSSSVTLSWNAVSGVTGYAIYTVSGSKYSQVASSATNSCVVSGLKSSTVYTFAVRAYITASDSKNYFSAYSDTLTTKTAPAPVSDLRVAESKNNSVTLSWTASPDSIDGYEIFALVPVQNLNGSTTNQWVSLGSNRAGTTSYTVSAIRYENAAGNKVELPIEQKTDYEFKVQAYSIYSYRNPIDPEETLKAKLYSTSVNYTATTALTRVLNLKTQNPTGSSLTVSWTVNTKADGYKLEISKDAKTWEEVDLSKCTPVSTDNISIKIYTVSGLDVSTKYYFRVSATAGANVSMPSDVAEGKTTPAAITDLTLKASTDTSVTVTWNAVDGAVKYDLFWLDGSAANADWTKLTETDKTEFTQKQLAQLTEYKFKVRAYTDGQSVPSEFSNELVVTTGLSKIVDLSVQVAKCTSDSLYIGWTPNSKASSYKLEVSADNKTWTEVNAEIKNPEKSTDHCVYIYKDSSLAPSTVRYFRVTVVSGEIQSDLSNVLTAKTAPSPVEDLTVSEVGDSTVSLSWKKHSSVGKYVVEYRKNSDSSWKEKTTDTNSITVTGLSEYTDYKFRVSAFEVVGSKRLASTPTELSGTVTTLLSAVKDLKVTAQGADYVSLSWTKHSNSAVTGYYVEQSETGRGNWQRISGLKITQVEEKNDILGFAISSTTVCKVTVGNLSPSQTLYFRVIAYDKSGTTGAPTTNSVVGKTNPAKPTVKVSEVTDASVTLDWSGSTNIVDKYQVVCLAGTKEVFNKDVTGSRYTVTGLDQCTEYTFKVTAINGSAKSETVELKATTLLSQVQDFKATLSGNTVILNWKANDKADGYLIKANDTDDKTVGKSVTSTTIEVAPGNTYKFNIYPVKNGVNGMVAVSSSVGPVAPETPTLGTPVVNGNKITLTWTDKNSGAYYVVYVDGKAVAGEDGKLKAKTYTYTGELSKSYNFYVVAHVSKDSKSANSNTETASTALAPVSDVEVTKRDADSVTVTLKGTFISGTKYYIYDNAKAQGTPLASGNVKNGSELKNVKISGIGDGAKDLYVTIGQGTTYETETVKFTVGAYTAEKAA